MIPRSTQRKQLRPIIKTLGIKSSMTPFHLEGSKVKSDQPKDLGHVISYKLSSHPKLVGPIMNKFWGIERSMTPFDLRGICQTGKFYSKFL